MLVFRDFPLKILVLLSLLFSFFICQPMSGNEEIRALWVVRTALKSPEAVRRIVELASKYGFNTLIVQVRGRGDAWYSSSWEPRAEGLEGQPPDFDPLQLILKEAHSKGIKVHAWLNTFFVWSGDHPPKAPSHLVNAHPEWLLQDKEGKLSYRPGKNVEGLFLDPSLPEVRKWNLRVFLDVVRRYEVDGIHFDFVRYPGWEWGYSDRNLRDFGKEVSKKVPQEVLSTLLKAPDRLALIKFFPESWKEWRRRNVTAVVQAIVSEVRRVKPHLTISAATIAWGPFTSWESSEAYNRVGQNWFEWHWKRLLDVVVPMAYHTSTEQFAGWIEAAVKNAGDRPVWAGIGAYLIPPESAAEKVRKARALGAKGFSLFSYDAITKDGTEESYLKTFTALINP